MRKHRAGISPGVTAPQRSVSTLKKVAVLVSAALVAGPAFAGSFGMVADNESDMFRLFDSETGVVVASVLGSGGRIIGDCALSTDVSSGF